MVRTERLGGGEPMSVGYAAAYTKRDEAIAAVKRHIEATSGDTIGATGPLNENTAKALGLKPGHVWML